MMRLPMATTLPTHLTLMTGLTPHEHGTTANIVHGGTRFVPSERVQTAAQLAKKPASNCWICECIP